jgi:hypothetical protein
LSADTRCFSILMLYLFNLTWQNLKVTTIFYTQPPPPKCRVPDPAREYLKGTIKRLKRKPLSNAVWKGDKREGLNASKLSIGSISDQK